VERAGCAHHRRSGGRARGRSGCLLGRAARQDAALRSQRGW
jgi:hypothetical protein